MSSQNRSVATTIEEEEFISEALAMNELECAEGWDAELENLAAVMAENDDEEAESAQQPELASDPVEVYLQTGCGKTLPEGKGGFNKLSERIDETAQVNGVRRAVVFTFPEVKNPEENMKLSLKKIINDLLSKVPDGTFCTINFHHPAIQDRQGTILKPGRFSTSTRRLEHNTSETLLRVLGLLTQSNKEVRYDTRFKLELIYFAPPSGAGRKENGVLTLGQDSFCLPRAIIVGKAAADRDEETEQNLNRPAQLRTKAATNAFDSLIKERNHRQLTRKAVDLLDKARLPLNNPSYSITNMIDIHRAVDELEDYEIIVYCPNGDTLTVLTRYGSGSKLIRLFFNDNHFEPVVDRIAFMKKYKFCDVCEKKVTSIRKHRCSSRCSKCGSRNDQCRGSAEIECQDCNRTFYNQSCFERHNDLRPNGARSLCASKKYCSRCTKEYDVVTGKPHVCFSYECRFCKKQVTNERHSCFWKSTTPAQRALFVNNQPKPRFIFFDVETVQNTIDENGEIEFLPRHVVNMVVAQKVCKKCIDKPMATSGSDENRYCPNCSERERIFDFTQHPEDADDNAVLDAFCRWLFEERSNKGYTLMAHFGGGFDSFFIMNYYYRYPGRFSSPPNLIESGVKMIQVEFFIAHPDTGKEEKWLTVKDSYNFIPIALAKFPKTFGLTELRKGFFPFLGNAKRLYGTVSAQLPELKYYQPEKMASAKKLEFLAWYEANKENSFDFNEELRSYCVSDVNLLREGALAYRKLHMGLSCIDPFVNASTIASYLMLVYRKRFLKERTIAHIPEKGYHAGQKQSALALKYLLWMKENDSDLANLQTKLSPDGEKIINIGNGHSYRADGFLPPTSDDYTGTIFEIDGCHVHGCEKCYPCRTDIAVNGNSHQVNYDNTMRKKKVLEGLGYIVVNIPTCKIDAELAEDKKKKRIEDRSGIVEFFKLHEDISGVIDSRDTFFGGRTEVFRSFYKAKKGEKIRYLDVCSLYPFVNRSKPYPIGEPKIIDSGFQSLRPRQPLPYKGFVRCLVQPPRNCRFPVLPYRFDNRLYFTLCKECTQNGNQGRCNHPVEKRQFTGAWTHFELNHAIRKGYKIAHIYDVWQWDKWTNDPGQSSLFKEYIDTYLKPKMEASGYPRPDMTDAEKEQYVEDFFNAMGIRLDPTKIEYNEGLRFIAKLALNSFWGKLGQRSDLCQTKIIGKFADLWNVVTDETVEVLSLGYYCDVPVVRYRKRGYAVSTNKSGNVPLASITTSHARLELLKHLEAVGNRAIYCDTDSVIFVEKEGENLLQTGENLGDLTDELDGGEIVEITCAGPKQYGYVKRSRNWQYDLSVKIRGITLNDETMRRLSYDDLRHLTLQNVTQGSSESIVTSRTTLKRRRGGEIETVTADRSYVPVNKKGRINRQSGIVYPYGYDE